MRSSCKRGIRCAWTLGGGKGQMLLDSEAFLARLTLQLQDCATAEIPKR
jgi:hypothetical protein